MSTPAAFEAVVQQKVLPAYRPIVAKIRAIAKKAAPQASEEVSYGVPVFRVRNIIAVISPTKKGITLAFSRGVEMKDPKGLLEGVGNVSKNVRVSSVAELDEAAVHDFFRQAVALHAVPKAAKARVAKKQRAAKTKGAAKKAAAKKKRVPKKKGAAKRAKRT